MYETHHAHAAFAPVWLLLLAAGALIALYLLFRKSGRPGGSGGAPRSANPVGTCPRCRGTVSFEAAFCPRCGAAIPRPVPIPVRAAGGGSAWLAFLALAAIALVGFLVWSYFAVETTPQSTPPVPSPVHHQSDW